MTPGRQWEQGDFSEDLLLLRLGALGGLGGLELTDSIKLGDPWIKKQVDVHHRRKGPRVGW